LPTSFRSASCDSSAPTNLSRFIFPELSGLSRAKHKAATIASEFQEVQGSTPFINRKVVVSSFHIPQGAGLGAQLQRWLVPEVERLAFAFKAVKGASGR
jgi:hypothetical protein